MAKKNPIVRRSKPSKLLQDNLRRLERRYRAFLEAEGQGHDASAAREHAAVISAWRGLVALGMDPEILWSVASEIMFEVWGEFPQEVGLFGRGEIYPGESVLESVMAPGEWAARRKQKAKKRAKKRAEKNPQGMAALRRAMRGT